jgi:hypothetical protein
MLTEILWQKDDANGVEKQRDNFGQNHIKVPNFIVSFKCPLDVSKAKRDKPRSYLERDH